MRQWIDSLSDEELLAPPPGPGRSASPLVHVMHLVSDAIQQFSEAAVLLTRAGHSPDDIGFGEFALTSGGHRPN